MQGTMHLFSYPESSGALASGWLPRNGSALIHCRNPAVKKFQYLQVSPGNQPLAKETEDSGYEIKNALCYGQKSHNC